MKYSDGAMFRSLMLTPGAVCHNAINRSGCGYGRGFSSTPSITLKIAAFAPIPIASVTSEIAVNMGERASRRKVCRRGLRIDCTYLDTIQECESAQNVYLILFATK